MAQETKSEFEIKDAFSLNLNEVSKNKLAIDLNISDVDESDRSNIIVSGKAKTNNWVMNEMRESLTGYVNAPLSSREKSRSKGTADM